MNYIVFSMIVPWWSLQINAPQKEDSKTVHKEYNHIKENIFKPLFLFELAYIHFRKHF